MSGAGGERGIAGRLDGLPEEAARGVLARCCGSRRWVEAMLAIRPFERDRAVLEAAERLWWSLPEEDWLEAFAAHPRLGDPEVAEGWSRSEQAGAAGADPEVLAALAAGNREYEARFGFVFLLCAADRSAEEMLGALRDRLGRTREEELETAAREQASILRLRLARLRTGPAPEPSAAGPATAASGAAAAGPVDDRGSARGDGPRGKGTRVTITTHVLDTASGVPAEGVRVTLERAGPGREWAAIFAGTTDADGRVANMLEPEAADPGVYRLRFDTGTYFDRHGVAAFHPHVEVTFRVDELAEHYHVPLLLSPFGFTTYRGS